MTEDWMYQYPSTSLTRTYRGDRIIAGTYRGEADKLLYQLKNLMEFRKLGQLKMTRLFTDGTVITAKSHFGYDLVEIDVSQLEKLEEEIVPTGIPVMVTFVKTEKKIFYRFVEESYNYYIDISDIGIDFGSDYFFYDIKIIEQHARLGVLFYRYPNNTICSLYALRYYVGAALKNTYTYNGKVYTQHKFTYAIDSRSMNYSGEAAGVPFKNATLGLASVPSLGNYPFMYTYGNCGGPYGGYPEICWSWGSLPAQYLYLPITYNGSGYSYIGSVDQPGQSCSWLWLIGCVEPCTPFIATTSVSGTRILSNQVRVSGEFGPSINHPYAFCLEKWSDNLSVGSIKWRALLSVTDTYTYDVINHQDWSYYVGSPCPRYYSSDNTLHSDYYNIPSFFELSMDGVTYIDVYGMDDATVQIHPTTYEEYISPRTRNPYALINAWPVRRIDGAFDHWSYRFATENKEDPGWYDIYDHDTTDHWVSGMYADPAIFSRYVGGGIVNRAMHRVGSGNYVYYWIDGVFKDETWVDDTIPAQGKCGLELKIAEEYFQLSQVPCHDSTGDIASVTHYGKPTEVEDTWLEQTATWSWDAGYARRDARGQVLCDFGYDSEI